MNRYIRFLVLFALGCALIPARVASAQRSERDGNAQYEAMITEGLAEFQAQRYAEARALFERAHALSPNARTLRGIGMVAFEMRDYPHAWSCLRAALEHPERPLTPAQRQDVTALLERTIVFLARLELAGMPEGGHVLVDGREAVLDGAVVLLGPGTHLIAIEAEGMRPFSRELTVVAGSTPRLAVTLEPTEQVASATTPSRDVAPAAPATERSVAPWIVVAGGGGLVVVGATLGGIGLARARDPDRDAQNARRLGYAADALLGVGIVTSVGGLVWGLRARRSDSTPEVTAVPVITRQHAGVAVGGSF